MDLKIEIHVNANTTQSQFLKLGELTNMIQEVLDKELRKGAVDYFNWAKIIKAEIL